MWKIEAAEMVAGIRWLGPDGSVSVKKYFYLVKGRAPGTTGLITWKCDYYKGVAKETQKFIVTDLCPARVNKKGNLYAESDEERHGISMTMEFDVKTSSVTISKK